jgi:hypothetical protein
MPKVGNSHQCTWFSISKQTVATRLDSVLEETYSIETTTQLVVRMGFQSSRADQDLWWRKSPHYKGYDYLATQVDDVICVGKDPL